MPTLWSEFSSIQYVLPLSPPSLREIRLRGFGLLDIIRIGYWTDIRLGVSNMQELLYIRIFIGIFIVSVVLSYISTKKRTFSTAKSMRLPTFPIFQR